MIADKNYLFFGDYWGLSLELFVWLRNVLYCFITKQECIPVGCVPPAHWPKGGGREVLLSRGGDLVPGGGRCCCPEGGGRCCDLVPGGMGGREVLLSRGGGAVLWSGPGGEGGAVVQRGGGVVHSSHPPLTMWPIPWCIWCNTSPPGLGQTNACENITFARFATWAVIRG